MLQLGQKVVYGIHGVCTILETEVRSINRKKSEYYVLEPVEQQGTRFYVPTNNEAAVAKLKPLLSEDDLNALIVSETARTDIWIADENHRKQRYRELLISGDRAALLSMIHTLHKQKRIQEESGRKFHMCDENFLRDAQKLLSSEFSLVLGVSLSEVTTYIENLLKEKV